MYVPAKKKKKKNWQLKKCQHRPELQTYRDLVWQEGRLRDVPQGLHEEHRQEVGRERQGKIFDTYRDRLVEPDYSGLQTADGRRQRPAAQGQVRGCHLEVRQAKAHLAWKRQMVIFPLKVERYVNCEQICEHTVFSS